MDSSHPGEALFIAAGTGPLSKVKRLVERHGSAILNHRTKSDVIVGLTPLGMAAVQDHMDIVRYLVQKGADLDAASDSGQTPLHLAADLGQAAVMRLLLQHGAKTDRRTQRTSQTPLHLAAVGGHVDAAAALLDAGAELYALDRNGLSPFYLAAQEGRVAVIDLLVARGMDVNWGAVDAEYLGRTALHVASLDGGHLAAVRRLLHHGARVDQADVSGWTALLLAARDGYISIVKCLLDAGAEPNRMNERSPDAVSPLMMACREGRLDVAQLLIKRGAAVNQVSAWGATALQIAAQQGHLDIVKLLSKHGADASRATDYGLLPLDAADMEGHDDVAQFLAGEGAEFKTFAAPRCCKVCGASGVPLMKCKGCLAVSYCGGGCQRRDWKEGGEARHKVQCCRLKEQQLAARERVKAEMERRRGEVAKQVAAGDAAGNRVIVYSSLISQAD